MDSLIDQVKKLTIGADATARHSLAHQLRGLAVQIESPREAVLRHTYAYTNAAACQVAANLDIFKILVENEKPISIDAIAEKTKADPLLIGRIMRSLASNHTVAEVGENLFAANNTTKALATPAGTGGIAHGFNFLDLCAREIPAHLEANGYKSPSNAFDGPFQAAFKTDQHAFIWVQTQPAILGNFIASLPSIQGPSSWTAAFPLESKLAKADPMAPVFVDVGGGVGGQCVAFMAATKDKYKDRVVLQDLPETLERAPKVEGVKPVVQNFFERQSTKGAAIYYLRNVLHDHPDERCFDILKNQIGAMGPNSRILLDELVLPNTGASVMATGLDLTMMATLSAIERTEANWQSLMEKAGLEIIDIYRYDTEMGYGIVEAVPKK